MFYFWHLLATALGAMFIGRFVLERKPMKASDLAITAACGVVIRAFMFLVVKL